jgi:hypothetical protein
MKSAWAHTVMNRDNGIMERNCAIAVGFFWQTTWTRPHWPRILAEAAHFPVRTHTESFSLNEAKDALIALKHYAIKGAGVLEIASGQ